MLKLVWVATFNFLFQIIDELLTFNPLLFSNIYSGGRLFYLIH